METVDGSNNTSDEKSVSGEDSLIIAILEKIADTVLRVTGSVQCFDLDITNGEGLAMCGCLCHLGAVLAADDGKRVGFKLDRGQFGVLKRHAPRHTSSTLPPAWSW